MGASCRGGPLPQDYVFLGFQCLSSAVNEIISPFGLAILIVVTDNRRCWRHIRYIRRELDILDRFSIQLFPALNPLVQELSEFPNMGVQLGLDRPALKAQDRVWILLPVFYAPEMVILRDNFVQSKDNSFDIIPLGKAAGLPTRAARSKSKRRRLSVSGSTRRFRGAMS